MASLTRSGSDWVGGGGTTRRGWQPRASSDAVRGAVPDDRRELGCVEEQRRAMEGEGRLGTLVAVDVAAAEPVAAAARREVVQRPVQMVATQEPVERRVRAHAVLPIAGDVERRELSLDERGRVERLLVAKSGCGPAARAPFVTRQPQHPVVEPRFASEPAQ